MSGSAYRGISKIRTLLGNDLMADLQGKTVIDFGCGSGEDAIEMARAGTRRVIGIDIREEALIQARRRAEQEGVSEHCIFQTKPTEAADAIVSLDSFEHFSDPEQILKTMYDLLPPGGFVATSFGPTWYHPYGGHLFSVFPWAHLMFSESALIRWRADLRSDGATRFAEVKGGLNQMTIRHFERCVKKSTFELERIDMVPIQKIAWLHGFWTREFTTAIVRAKLRKPSLL